MRDNPEGGESDPADDVRRHCKKNSLSVLSCVGKRTKEGVTVAAKSEQFTAGDTGKDQASSSEETEGIWQKREL